MGKKSKLVVGIEKLEKELDEDLEKVRVKREVINQLRELAGMYKRTVKADK